MRFELKAVGQEGRVEALDLDAYDRDSAVKDAESRGYTVLSARSRGAFLDSLRRRGSAFPVALFSQELLVLLGAGLPLVDSIETLAQKERNPELRAALDRIASTLRVGRPLSVALEALPRAFPALYVATVRASERTGDLGAALGRYLSYAQQLDAVRKRLLNAAIYPLLLAGVGALVSLFLMFYVVPRFSRIYEDRAADLPLFSKVLFAWGSVVEGHAVLVLSLLAGGALLAAQGLRSAGARGWISATLWRFAPVGERMKLYQLARFYRTVGMLLRGGTPLVTALDMASELLHAGLRASLALARHAISEGRPVAASLEAHGLTTPVALRMLAVGEHSGNMGEMMDRIAVFHDEEIARWVDWFTRLFEPLLMAAIGLVIGAIVILMYLPIFELAGSLR
jgi:general secretion pathway protein F